MYSTVFARYFNELLKLSSTNFSIQIILQQNNLINLNNISKNSSKFKNKMEKVH